MRQLMLFQRSRELTSLQCPQERALLPGSRQLGRSLRAGASALLTGAIIAAGSSSTAAAVRTPAPRKPAGTVAAKAKPALALALALAGKVVGVDPGHNGGNFDDPTYINRLIWNGREMEPCNTTGTETDGGYTEALFNFNVGIYLAADLRAEGAKVVMTRTTNSGVGPCVNTRSEMLNDAHANVALSIHADGGPPCGRGFAILEPVADGPNDRVIGASERFGHDLLERYLAVTGMPVSTYDGDDGISDRDDLAGENLTTVPKVLIECGNMRNATDAARLVSASFQKLAAKAMAEAITLYLTGHV